MVECFEEEPLDSMFKENLFMEVIFERETEVWERASQTQHSALNLSPLLIEQLERTTDRLHPGMQ